MNKYRIVEHYHPHTGEKYYSAEVSYGGVFTIWHKLEKILPGSSYARSYVNSIEEAEKLIEEAQEYEKRSEVVISVIKTYP